MKQIALILTTIFLLQTELIHAQAGTLDSSFGNNGKVYHDSLKIEFRAMTLQKDGKFVIAGFLYRNKYNKIEGPIIQRFNNDGRLDENFGINGSVVFDYLGGNSVGQIVALAIDKHQKIIICSPFYTSVTGNRDAGIIRLNSDGSLDTKFDKDGFSSRDVSYDDRPSDMILQKDGKIVTAGVKRDRIGNIRGNFVIRYLADGRPDTSFGIKGAVSTETDYNNFEGALTQQSDGKIIYGCVYGYSLTNYLITRYNLNGSVDSTYGVNGFAKFVPQGFGSIHLNAITVQEDGKVVAAGQFENQLAVVRFDSTGKVDSSFGNFPGYYVAPGSGYSVGQSVFMTGNNRILVTGISNIDTANHGLAIFKFLNNGMPDLSFGINGIGVADFSDEFEKAYPGGGYGVIQKDSKVVLGGSGSSYEILLARFNARAGKQNYIVNNNLGSEIIASKKIKPETIIIKMYPNPVQNRLRIEGLNNATKTTLCITDLNGNIMMATTVNAVTYEWNIAILQKGNYLLTMQIGSSIITKKFIKE